ncbi:hypothetical protein AZE42_08654 [Rhizopogon vesiculosus]|uniref:Uncharacterized protein n=1 Tax=Rhizopogon vesiculosus TaxID=180088 RepID=A0A1J8PV46_9AGAM|nr:hypothetical protein AZE42_08654 [Rhizopogon vesiculosus]
MGLSATHMSTMTLPALAITTDNADILSPPASSALLTPDYNFPCILPYSNRYALAFLPTSCLPGATSSCRIGAGQHRE